MQRKLAPLSPIVGTKRDRASLINSADRWDFGVDQIVILSVAIG